MSRGLGSPSLLGLMCPFPLSQVAIRPGSCRLLSAGANRAPAQPASKARTRSRDRFPEVAAPGGPTQPPCSISNGPTTLGATLSRAAPPSLPPSSPGTPSRHGEGQRWERHCFFEWDFFGWGSGQQGCAFPEGQASFPVWLPSPLIG